MSELETTALKLRTTPTGGVSGEHSPYYRRLLSAGYKGFLQGTIGGAGLYGTFGLAIGALVAIPAFFLVPGLGAAAFLLIPAAAGVGLMKGANTFGNIGTVAAINAESAELTEQRRYLLDLYHNLPEGPEGDKEAAIIKDELARQYTSGEAHQVFHWKTVAICAAVGAVLALACCTPLGIHLLMATPLSHVISAFLVSHTAAAAVGATATVATAEAAGAVLAGPLLAIGTALGAAMGATIGIDRHYIRSWFDGSEKLLHDESHSSAAAQERGQLVERLQTAAKQDAQTKRTLEQRDALHADERQASQPSMLAEAHITQPIASLDTPGTQVMSVAQQSRLADAQKAMATPTV